jgi:hypothetical protein
MTREDVTHIAGRRFRAGSSYEIVTFERLPASEQAAVAGLRTDRDFYGILRPREGSGRTVQGIGKDTALLWLTLREPGPLPGFVWSGDAEAAAKGITELVLDGVLEMEEAGHWVSGPDALAALESPAGAAVEGRLARRSREALLYAERLAIADADTLCARIYHYGRAPLTPSWSQRLPDRDAVLAFLGAAPGGPLARELAQRWDMNQGELRGWIAWGHRRRGRAATASGTFKLYVSSQIESMPMAFAAVVAALAERGGHFKVGGDAAGLLRPDKMVLYFAELETLLEVGREIADRLAGAPVHGVPFTAEVAGAGLLSWGMDPPALGRAVAWHEQESWRLWVARRLALAMVAAQAGGSRAASPAEFALARLRHEGVDVDGWTPSSSMWWAA